MLPALLLLFAASVSSDDSLRAGLIALQRGDLASAQTNLEAASKLSPRDGRVWVALSQPKYSSKVPENNDARERAGELYFEAAQPLLDQQKFTKAVAILKEAVARLPKSAQLELALGVADYGLRRFHDAADTVRFAEYESARPASAAAYLLHAKALDAQSLEPEMALGLHQKSITLNAGDASVHFEVGTALDRLKRFADATVEFQRAAELAPSDAAAHYRLARDYDRIGKHEAAQAEREQHARLVKAQEAIR